MDEEGAQMREDLHRELIEKASVLTPSNRSEWMLWTLAKQNPSIFDSLESAATREELRQEAEEKLKASDPELYEQYALKLRLWASGDAHDQFMNRQRMYMKKNNLSYPQRDLTPLIPFLPPDYEASIIRQIKNTPPHQKWQKELHEEQLRYYKAELEEKHKECLKKKAEEEQNKQVTENEEDRTLQWFATWEAFSKELSKLDY